MKCIKCNIDNKLKERSANGGRCKSCKHPFVFDPKANPEIGITDWFFANTISAVSANGTLSFTEKQFYYLLNARKSKGINLKIAGIICFIIGLFSVPILLGSSASPVLIFLAFVALLIGILLLIPKARSYVNARRGKRTTITPSRFKQLITMWTVTNGAIPHLLQPASALPGRADITDEIKKYSFDRLVVCEHASIAKFLIANKFHFENNCAVLSIDKYPQNLFETVMEMLRRNPALKVYALHDASPSGIQLAHRIATDADWFKGSSNVTIYDLGLLPRQLIDKSSFVLESMESAAVARLLLGGPGSASLRPDEDRWLRQGKHVSLESIPPKVLLRVAALGIARSRDPRAQDALVPLSGAEYGSGFYIFAYDSFG